MTTLQTQALATTEPMELSTIERMAAICAKSGLFGMKTPEQAAALMLLCQAENIHPMLAVRDYHIIQGRPALKSDAMLARYQAAGGRVKWTALADSRCEAVFTHPASGDVTITWDTERAKQAGLTGKDNWRNYPRQMLRARVISEGVRTSYPAVVCGIYSPEEVGDMMPDEHNGNGSEPRKSTTIHAKNGNVVTIEAAPVHEIQAPAETQVPMPEPKPERNKRHPKAGPDTPTQPVTERHETSVEPSAQRTPEPPASAPNLAVEAQTPVPAKTETPAEPSEPCEAITSDNLLMEAWQFAHFDDGRDRPPTQDERDTVLFVSEHKLCPEKNGDGKPVREKLSEIAKRANVGVSTLRAVTRRVLALIEEDNAHAF